MIRQPNRGQGRRDPRRDPAVDGEIAVIQDADMEYDPAEVPELIEPIVRGAADVVFGSRLSGGQPQRAYLFWHLVGNRFLSLLTYVLFNTTLSDMETGYKAFRIDVLRSLDLREDDFGIEPEITGKVCKRKLRIYELPISYYGRTYDEGKKITWRDGFRAIWVLAPRPRSRMISSKTIAVVVPAYRRGGADRRDARRHPRASSTASTSSTTPRATRRADRARKRRRRPARRACSSTSTTAASAPRSSPATSARSSTTASTSSRVMAGDNQMDPGELEAIVGPVVRGEVDYAKANRLITGRAWDVIPHTRYLGNAVLSLLTKIASGYWHVADSQAGYTAISRRHARPGSTSTASTRATASRTTCSST